MIRYTSDLENIGEDMLDGFFVGWPNPPSAKTHLEILSNSYKILLAIDDEHGRVVGFINAISDGCIAAFIPLLEVLPGYQGQGIGTHLMMSMIESLEHLYMVDLGCDSDKVSYYKNKCGMLLAGNLMSRRNYNVLG